MSLLTFIIVFLAAAVGSTLQGAVGFGLNLFVAPVLMLVDPGFVPGPIMAGALVLTVLITLRDRSGIDLGGMRWMTIGLFPGVLVGSLLLPIIPLRELSLLLGGLVLLTVVLNLTGLQFPPRHWILTLAGFFSGISGVLASLGAPPVALVNQKMEGNKLRATLSGFFIFASVLSLVGLRLAGRFGASELEHSLWLMPGILLGYLVSKPLADYVDRGRTRQAVLLLSGVSGALLILQKLIG